MRQDVRMDHADHACRLSERVETLARWVREDVDAGDYARAETNAVAAIDAAVAMRELIGGMATGHERVKQLIA
jgi:hypothetical protein